MKLIKIILLSTLIFLCIGCKKEVDTMNSGQITGPDMSLCPCCGGWFIDIDNHTYRFLELPENSNFNIEDETFPINVNLDWQNDANACLGDEIIISAINKK